MIKSYAKINLFLKVLKKKSNSLHDIQSSTMLLNLYDRISIKKINKNQDEIKFIGQFRKNISVKNNTMIKSLNLLRKYELIHKKIRYKIIIDKKIPIFAGLGGGTSNAAFLIKYLLKKRINKKILTIFERKIGSDFRLFFKKHSFQRSLEKIIEFKKKFIFYFILVYPNINCSIKEIYSKVMKYSVPLKDDLSKIESKIKYLKFIESQNNDLQSIVEKKYYNLKKILKLIKIQKNCLFSRMTGSGSVCFGVFLDEKSAKLSLKLVKKKFPNYWCIVAKSI